MKRTVLIIIVATLLASCSNENKMESELKKYVEQNFNDPKSYELINIKVWDTIYAKELAKNEIIFNEEKIIDYQTKIAEAETQIKLNKDLNKKYNSNTFDEFIMSAKSDLDFYSNEIQSCKKTNESLNKYIDNNKVIGYLANHECRANNKLGGKIKESYQVFFDKDFNLIKHGATYQDALKIMLKN